MSTFYSNFDRACYFRNTTKIDVLKQAGMSDGNLSRWKRGQLPSTASLMKLCEILNVTPEILTGSEIKSAEDLEQKETPTQTHDESESAYNDMLVKLYKEMPNLSESQIRCLYNLIIEMKAKK